MTKATAEAPTTEAMAGTVSVALTVKKGPGNIHEIDPLTDERWSNLVDNDPRSSIFHTTGWLRALRNVYGYEPVLMTTSSPAAPLTNGAVFCRIKSWLTGSRLVSLPFSDHCEPLVRNEKELDSLLIHMRRNVDAAKWKYAEIRPITFEPGSGTKYSKHLSYCFHRLDLTPGIDQVFRRFHKDCVQRKIRRAEKEKLMYEAGNSDALLEKFYRLMVATRRRKALPPQPLQWFQGLMAEFGEDFQIRVASCGNLPVASIITLTHKKSMTYKYGCSDIAFNKLGGMAMLLWKAIQDAKSAGCEQLDLGRSDSDNLGLIAFKDHWGAASTVLSYWTYPQQPESCLKFGGNSALKQITALAPKKMLTMIGRILYKHIG